MRNCLTFFPAYNKRQIIACATLRDLSELDHVKDAIKKQPTVLELKTYLWTGIKNIPENMNLESPHKSTNIKDENNFQKNGKATKKADELDKQIIEILAKNGRLPFTQIAKELKTSTDTVIKRFEKLKNVKAIKVVIQIDPSKMGYQAVAAFNVALMSQSDATGIVKKISEIPDVIHIVKTSGDYDLDIFAVVKNFDHFFAIRDEISKRPYTNIVDELLNPIFHVWPVPNTYLSTID